MERHRIDHWLKLVCLFKHRSEAADACRGGRVKLNGSRVKPSTPVREEDVVEFYQGTQFRRVVVAGMPATSVSKETARTMYVDQTPRQTVDPTLVYRERGAGRPTKKDRRDMERFEDNE